MINETVSAVVGLAQGTMVSYIISFLFSVGVIYLTVLGAIRLFNVFYVSYQALQADRIAAKAEGLGLFSYWKARAKQVRETHVERTA